MNVPGASSPRLSWVDDHKTTLLLLYSVTYTVMEVGFNRLLTDSVAGSVAATTWKSAQRDANTARWLYKLSEIYPPRRRPPSRGLRTPKFGDGYYLHLQTQFGEARCTQFRVIVVTDVACPPKHRQDRLQYTAPLASAQVITVIHIFILGVPWHLLPSQRHSRGVSVIPIPCISVTETGTIMLYEKLYRN